MMGLGKTKEIDMEGIKKGDKVQVDFNGAQITLTRDAEVIYVPCATGDSWIFKGNDTGFLYYVSEGCTVSKKLA